MNIFRTTLLLTVLTLLLVLAGNALGGANGMKIAFVIALVMNFGSYWFSDKIVLKMYKAQEVTRAEAPELYGMVEQLCRNAGLPMPKTYIIQNPAPNAFATGRNPSHAAVAVTTGILQLLDRNELMGVLAHELAHVKHRDILIGSVAATIAGAIAMMANIAKWGMIFGGGHRDNNGGGGGGIAAIAMMIIAPIAAMVIQMAISRSREYAADRGGAEISGNPRYLSSALNKLATGIQRAPMDASPATAHMFIVNPLRGGGLASLFSTHPPMEERIRRLEAMRA
ncbi:MAG: zinc metalloprotease HtpX [bacterium]|nr:zinc metalloprotease HtpX [bacterium]